MPICFYRCDYQKSEKAVSIIADYIKEKDIVVVLGAPVAFYNQIYNCAVVLDNSGVKGIVPKSILQITMNFMKKVVCIRF